MADTDGVVVAPNDCCHDNGCDVSVVGGMKVGVSSVGAEEDTTRRKMAAVGKRHSKCPRRLGEEGGVGAGLEGGRNKKKSTRIALRDDAADVVTLADAKENGEKEVADGTKKRVQTAARKRKSDERGTHNDVATGDTDNQVGDTDNQAGDMPDKPVLVAEETSPVKAKRQRKVKPGKDSEANSSDREPKLKATKRRVKPKKQPGGPVIDTAMDSQAKEQPSGDATSDTKETPGGDTDCQDKTKVAAKPKAKKKKALKSESKLEKSDVSNAQAVKQAAEHVVKPPAKPNKSRKKVMAGENKKNSTSASNSDIGVASQKGVSPAKKKKLNKCAKDDKPVVDADSASAENNTQDVTLHTTDATGGTDANLAPRPDTEDCINASMAPHLDTDIGGAEQTTNTIKTEHSEQQLKQPDCPPRINLSTGTAMSPVDTQCHRTEPKVDEREGKVPESSEEDASRCFPCSHCPYRAKRKVQLRKHLGTHGVHQCAHCEFVCESGAALTEHMQVVHPDKYGRKKCKRCLRIIKMGDIEEHEVACTGELLPWACTQCSKEFKYECQLNLHARAHITDNAATAVKSHPCPHCDYSAHVKANLAKHLKTVHGTDRQKTVKCPECEKLFYTPSHMRKHLKLHSDEMPFTCSVCTKAFRTARCLKRHTFVHMDSPAFVCSIDGCKMAFEKPALLKAHKLDCHQMADGATSSPPVKQFKCSYKDCEQAFYKKSHLARHEVIHTGERKFVCDWKDCGKAFRHSDNLRVHYRRHTNEKPMKCDQCNFTCRQKSSLQFHVKSRHETQTDANSETNTAQDTTPKTQNDSGAVPDGGSELKCDTPALLADASVTTGLTAGLAAGGVIRAAEMAPLVKTEVQPPPSKVSHDVYDFHDSDDDDNLSGSIGLQMRQKPVGKSPPGGALFNNSSFPSIRDEAHRRFDTSVVVADEKVALQNDSAIEPAVKADTAGKVNKKTLARQSVEGGKINGVPNDTPYTKAPSKKTPTKPGVECDKISGVPSHTPHTKAPSKKRKKKDTSSVEKKCEEVSSEHATTEKESVAPPVPTSLPVPTTSPVHTTPIPTSSGSTAAPTTTKTTKKKAASRRSRKKKPAAEEETTQDHASDSVERSPLQESARDPQKQVPHADGDVKTEVEVTRGCDVVPGSVEMNSVEDVPQQVSPSAAAGESHHTAASGSTSQLCDAETRPAGREHDIADDPVAERTDYLMENVTQDVKAEATRDVTEDVMGNVTEDVTEDVTEEEANELLPSPATVSQLMSEKDVNELSMPSLAHGSPSLSVHSDFVNNVAMSPRTYDESPQFDNGKCGDYEREKELEAATAEAESAIFEMPAITSQDQTKINDILDSQADLMPPSSGDMLEADHRSPFLLPGSAANAYSNAADSHDAYPSSVPTLTYPVDAMSANKKPLSDDNAELSQCYSGANSSYGGYPALPSVPERQSVLKSNPAAAVSCSYSPPQPAYQPLPSHSLYASRTASVLPPVGAYSHVPNPSFLLDPNLLANGSSNKGLESLRCSEPAYVISRDGPQVPVSSSSSSNKTLPISSCFPCSEGYTSSAKDFFGQYFQDPSTLPLTHLPTAADQRLSYHRAPHRAGFDFLPRVPGSAAVLPVATNYPASVSESLAAAINPAINPQHAQPHWGVDDRAHPWTQPSPMLMASDLNAARNPFTAGSSMDRAADLNFDPSVASRQLSKRSVPESTFAIPQSPATGPDPYGSMTSAYMGRAFNPAAAVAPSNYMMNMSSSMSSTQKQFEEAYRQSAVAAAAHIADYRSLGPQASVPDIYSRMAVNPALGLDKYYYTRREQMYRTQAIGAAANPFLAPPPTQTNSTPVTYASDYSCAQVMYAAAAQHSAAAYGFMGDKQYLMSSRKISEAVPMLPDRPPDYFPARPSTTEAQDPYRHSVIYNMMSRYY